MKLRHMSDQLEASRTTGPDIPNLPNLHERPSTKLSHIQAQISSLRLLVQEDRPVSEQIKRVNAIVAALRDIGLQIIALKVESKLGQMHGPTPESDDAVVLHGLISSAFHLPQSR